jgi:acyl carrier protein
MNERDVYERLTEIFRDVFVRDDIALQPHTTAVDVEGWDSMKQIDIVLATEERFKVTFTAREIDGLSKVGDLVELVMKRAH